MENKQKEKKIVLVVLAVLLVVLIGGAAGLYGLLTDAMEQEARERAQTQTAVAGENAVPSVTIAPATENAQLQQAMESEAPQMAGPMPKANLAKSFTVKTDAGEDVSLLSMRGKPTVVNFFASWCSPCKIEMPHFEEAYKTYGDTMNFMMVNLCAYGNDTKERAKAMVAEGGWTFPVYFDEEGSAVMAYSVRSMPTTIFVSADGELVSKRIGMLTKEQLQTEIDALLAK